MSSLDSLIKLDKEVMQLKEQLGEGLVKKIDNLRFYRNKAMYLWLTAVSTPMAYSLYIGYGEKDINDESALPLALSLCMIFTIPLFHYAALKLARRNYEKLRTLNPEKVGLMDSYQYKAEKLRTGAFECAMTMKTPY